MKVDWSCCCPRTSTESITQNTSIALRERAAATIDPAPSLPPALVDPFRPRSAASTWIGRHSLAGSISSAESGHVIYGSTSGPEVSRLRRIIFDEDVDIRQYMASPSGNCVNAAERVCALLTAEGHEFTVRALLIWNGAADLIPSNHLVVIVKINGMDHVIDPTAAQFGNCHPMFVERRMWEQSISTALVGRAVLYHDYPTVAEVVHAAGNLYHGGPESFLDSRILVRPKWYERVRGNPVAHRKLSAILDDGS